MEHARLHRMHDLRNTDQPQFLWPLPVQPPQHRIAFQSAPVDNIIFLLLYLYSLILSFPVSMCWLLLVVGRRFPVEVLPLVGGFRVCRSCLNPSRCLCLWLTFHEFSLCHYAFMQNIRRAKSVLYAVQVDLP